MPGLGVEVLQAVDMLVERKRQMQRRSRLRRCVCVCVCARARVCVCVLENMCAVSKKKCPASEPLQIDRSATLMKVVCTILSVLSCGTSTLCTKFVAICFGA